MARRHTAAARHRQSIDHLDNLCAQAQLLRRQDALAGRGLPRGLASVEKHPLLHRDNGLGLCLLFRFCSRAEPFPVVCDDNGGSTPGYRSTTGTTRYKWLPLIISTEIGYTP
jgi:hypothetical protein